MTLECRDTKLWPVFWVHHRCLHLEGQSKKKQPEKERKTHTHTKESVRRFEFFKKSKKNP
jgi:hypothetical protein